MGTLAADLVGTPRRERVGELVQERFDFQALWGMGLLLRMHDKASEYAVIFEFHDDIALIDDPEAPREVRFFQVKTKKKGSWNLAELKRRKPFRSPRITTSSPIPLSANDDTANEEIEKTSSRLGPSVLGKMFHNVRQFGDRVVSVTLISNAPCDLHSDASFEFKTCLPGTFATLISAVQAEYDDAKDTEVGLLGFERSDLSLEDSSTHMKGKLHDFVSRHIGSDEFPLDSLFRLIADECRKRSKFTGAAATLGDVIRFKGITRSQVQGWLDTVKTAIRLPSWHELEPMLSYGVLDKAALRQVWSVYRAEALNQADEALRIVRRSIRKRIAEGFSDTETLTQVVESTFDAVEAVGKTYLVPFRASRLKAMIIYEIYTQDPD